MKLVVIGLGYLGATHAACMAELGHDVLGVELDPTRLDTLASGSVPFYEPGLEPLLRKGLDSGRLRLTSSYVEAGEFGEVFFLAVGTPQKRGENAADLSYVMSAVRSLVPNIKGDSVILGKSTVPVGTCDDLRKIVNSLATDNVHIDLAWNPEFLREGHAIDDTLTPDRIVVGAEAESVHVVARNVYAQPLSAGTPYLAMDTTSAEMVKVAANSFLATKISFINAISEVCDAAGADISAVADAIGYDVRIGRRFLNAGLGFGGGCLPKDIRAFVARAGELGATEALTFLREVDHINMRRRARVVEVCRKIRGGSVLGARIAVLGAAFKPNSDDVRDSPALSVAGQLQLEGAAVTVYDPKAIANARRLFPTLAYADSVADCCTNADIVLVLTEWSEFVEVDPGWLLQHVAQAHVVDGRLCLDKEAWRAAGWNYVH